jgi:hypothetical protein
MVVKPQDKSTVIKQASNVLLLAPPMPCVLVPRELTAWPMVFASTAVAMLIARRLVVLILGVEMEVKFLANLSARTTYVSAPALTTMVE